jgi:hypothetical protein
VTAAPASARAIAAVIPARPPPITATRRLTAFSRPGP